MGVDKSRRDFTKSAVSFALGVMTGIGFKEFIDLSIKNERRIFYAEVEDREDERARETVSRMVESGNYSYEYTRAQSRGNGTVELEKMTIDVGQTLAGIYQVPEGFTGSQGDKHNAYVIRVPIIEDGVTTEKDIVFNFEGENEELIKNANDFGGRAKVGASLGILLKELIKGGLYSKILKDHEKEVPMFLLETKKAGDGGWELDLMKCENCCVNPQNRDLTAESINCLGVWASRDGNSNNNGKVFLLSMSI